MRSGRGGVRDGGIARAHGITEVGKIVGERLDALGDLVKGHTLFLAVALAHIKLLRCCWCHRLLSASPTSPRSAPNPFDFFNGLG